MIDIVESEKVVSRPGGFWGNSIRWEWNGSSFTITVIDTDGDGVNDDIDTCPNTPTGETVNSTGCSTTQLSVDDEILDNSLKLYPNPVTNILTIESKNVAISKVEIYSILGKKIKEITSNFGSITTDNLPNGIYSIRIYSEKSSIIRKMIKM
jgi:flagellar capping protein FliD